MRQLDCVVWEITLKCNAKCIHCGSAAGIDRENELSTKEILNICDQIADIGCQNVNLLGGELFLKKDWEKIVKKLRGNGIDVSLITNGICLNEKNLDFLASEGVKSIGISIDGGKSETHDYIRGVPDLFDKIFNAVSLMQDYSFDICAITTLNKLNYNELPLMRDIISESPFQVWEVQTASAHGRMTENLVLDYLEYYFSSLFLAKNRKKISPEKLAIVANHDFGYYSNFIPRHTIYDKWYGCPAGQSTLGIRSDGTVQGCLSLDNKNFSEISLKNKTLREIWESEDFCCWNLRDNKFKQLGGFCKTCEHSHNCLAGCSDTAYSRNGIVGNNPQCHYYIENHYNQKKSETNFETLFKKIINGVMNESGDIYLDMGESLTTSYIENFDLTNDEIKLLSLVKNN